MCENLLAIYLDEYEETPWDAMKYLIAQANYGGRVTDGQDRKILIVYINQFFCDAALNNPKYHLSSSDKYYIPEDGANREHYIKYINTLPNSDAVSLPSLLILLTATVLTFFDLFNFLNLIGFFLTFFDLLRLTTYYFKHSTDHYPAMQSSRTIN